MTILINVNLFLLPVFNSLETMEIMNFQLHQVLFNQTKVKLSYALCSNNVERKIHEFSDSTKLYTIFNIY